MTDVHHAHDSRKAERRAFMRLLRQGVRHKVQQQQEKQRALDDPTRDLGAEMRRGDESSTNQTSGDGTAAWQTLAWRDAFSMEPYFLASVDGKPLRIKQLLQGELKGFGTGLTVWPAACMLLKHLEHRVATTANNNGSLVANEQPFVLELGSGTGAVGIAAAMLLQAGRVVLTDMDNVRFLMQENAQLARDDGAVDSRVVIDVETYVWGEAPSSRLVPRESRRPDLLLVSDCILPKLYPIEPLVAALERLSDSHTQILISYEHRHYQHFEPKHRFWELLQARGFTLRELQAHEYHPQFRAEDIEIWSVTPPSSAPST